MVLATFGYAIIAIALITLFPAMFFVIYLRNTVSCDSRLLFVSTAIGALLGNAVYHLIPEALNMEESNVGVLTMLLAGMLLFLFGEQILQQYHSGHGHSHFETTNVEQVELFDDDHQHNHELPHHFGPLLVSSDLLHSFVDGIAIGTSFKNSPLTGISTAIAVFFHEVPHILGDYAVLTSTGFTRLQLCYYSGAIILSSVCGAAIVNVLESLISSDSNKTIQQALLAFASGNFLYIALADLIPEVLVKRLPSSSQGYLHYLCLLAGVAAMLVLKIFIH